MMQFFIQFFVLTTIVSGVLIFVLKKVLFDSTQSAVNRLNKETEDVRAKQSELNEKIKQANEELVKRRSEADALVTKMRTDAEDQAKQEREKIIKKAREDAEEIINKAQQTKNDIRRELEKEMELKAVDFTALLLKEILGEKDRQAFEDSLIAEFFEELEKVDVGLITDEIQSVEIVTCLPFSDKLKSRLAEILKRRLGRDFQLNISADKKLINGIVLKFSTLTLNGSLEAKLKTTGRIVKEKIEKGILKMDA